MSKKKDKFKPNQSIYASNLAKLMKEEITPEKVYLEQDQFSVHLLWTNKGLEEYGNFIKNDLELDDKNGEPISEELREMAYEIFINLYSEAQKSAPILKDLKDDEQVILFSNLPNGIFFGIPYDSYVNWWNISGQVQYAENAQKYDETYYEFASLEEHFVYGYAKLGAVLLHFARNKLAHLKEMN